MTQYILRISLDDGNGKWEPGTVLGAYLPDEKFGPGDMAMFHLFKLDVNATLDEVKSWRLKKVFDLKELLDEKELSQKLAQKKNIFERHCVTGEPLTMSDVQGKPDLTTAVAIADVTISDLTTVREELVIVEPTTEEIRRFG